MSAVNHQPRRIVTALLVVDADGGVQLGALVIRVYEYELTAQGLHFLGDDVRVVAYKDSAVEVALEYPVPAALAHADALYEHVIAKFCGLKLNAADKLAVEGVITKQKACAAVFLCYGQQQPEHIRATLGQAAGHKAGLIIEFLHDTEDVFPCSSRNFVNSIYYV